jgi:hypothetical protein
VINCLILPLQRSQVDAHISVKEFTAYEEYVLGPYEIVKQLRTKFSVKEHRLNKGRDWKESRDAPEERIIMNFGAAKVGSMKHIRGSMTGPHKALLDELNKMKSVLVITEDEWYTSQVCSSRGIRGLESLEVDGLSRCKGGENHIMVTKKERKQINSVAEALEKTSIHFFISVR